MLLEFRTKNFKTFEKEAVFSMLANTKQKGLDYSIHKARFNRKVYNILCSSVIYGHNASGKTCIIEAMDVLHSIILRGNIRNPNEMNVINPASSNLELIPNCFQKVPSPVEFAIVFSIENLKIKYELALQLGTFMDKTTKRKILKEKLEINDSVIFERDNVNDLDSITIGNLKQISKKVRFNRADNLSELAKNSLNIDELFLTNGFKSIYSSQLANTITDWFTNKFRVICRINSLQLNHRLSETSKSDVFIFEQNINNAAKIFGINSNDIAFAAHKDQDTAKLISLINIMNKGTGIAIDADKFESYGTIRFITVFPTILHALQNGGVLVVDEFDASIHPMAIMSIINLFHNDEINKNHAQLIFNTQNPVFLSPNIFRKDEIKFIERDKVEQSILYSLSDFYSNQVKSKTYSNYVDNYFKGKYGALIDIDFTPMFENILATENN